MQKSRARCLPPPMTKLLAILFWATLAAFALATFLDPAYPGIFDILNNH